MDADAAPNVGEGLDGPPELAEPLPPSASLTVQIRSGLNNKCLDIKNANTANGAEISMWTCHGGANQQWYWNGGNLRSKLNNECLDIKKANTANGAEVITWTCHDGAISIGTRGGELGDEGNVLWRDTAIELGRTVGLGC